MAGEFVQTRAPTAKHKRTLASTLVTDQASPCEACNVSVSAAKVEKVEKAPQNPTVKRRKSGWDFAGHPAAPADAWAIKVNNKAVASTLEASVLQGESHPCLLIPSPRLYRARLPSPPPMKTARKFIRG